VRRNSLNEGRQVGGTPSQSRVDAAPGGQRASAKSELETTMDLSFFRRYFHARHVYWNVVRELSTYSDRELHDLGIDRADIEQIARAASKD
jgi:uncharacterized protein YjiS (DUF1127 family)